MRRNQMSKLQTIMVIVGVLGAYATVSGPSPIIPVPTPNTPVIDYPSAPTKPSVLAHARQITAKLTSPEDALIIANTFRDWSIFLINDLEIRNTLEFRDVWVNSTKVFFFRTGMVGKYPGLDGMIENVMIESLRGSDPSLLSGKENVVLNTTIREAYRSAMNAVSWAAYKVVNPD